MATHASGGRLGDQYLPGAVPDRFLYVLDAPPPGRQDEQGPALGPPSMHEKQFRSSSILSRTSPPSRTRTQSFCPVEVQIAPSASRQMPSATWRAEPSG